MFSCSTFRLIGGLNQAARLVVRLAGLCCVAGDVGAVCRRPGCRQCSLHQHLNTVGRSVSHRHPPLIQVPPHCRTVDLPSHCHTTVTLSHCRTTVTLSHCRTTVTLLHSSHTTTLLRLLFKGGSLNFRPIIYSTLCTDVAATFYLFYTSLIEEKSIILYT